MLKSSVFECGELVNSDNKKNQSVAYRGLLILSSLTLVAALTLLILFSKVEAYSAFLGGMAYIIPNTYFVRYAFKFSGKDSADLALKWFYVGEALKLISTGLIIAFCLLVIKPINMFAFLGMFVVTMMLNLKFLLKNML